MKKEKSIIAGKEIKPCPFCGENAGVNACDQESGNFFIRCRGCGAVGPWYAYLSDAIEAWNERKEK